MLRLGLGPQIGTNTPVDSGGASIIWKVAIFGAGTTSSNGEYVWDGTTLENGKPKYFHSNGSYIYYNPNTMDLWSLFDAIIEDVTYSTFSESLLNWFISNGDSPAPSSALSYAQDSFISSITFTGGNTCNGTYTRSVGGSVAFIGPLGITDFVYQISYIDDGIYSAQLINGNTEFIDYQSEITWATAEEVNLFYPLNNDGFEGSPPFPKVSSASYSA